MISSSRYCSFTAKEKLHIIEEAEKTSNRAAGRKYDVSESCIRDWRKNKIRLQQTNTNRHVFRGQKSKISQTRNKIMRLY